MQMKRLHKYRIFQGKLAILVIKKLFANYRISKAWLGEVPKQRTAVPRS